MTPLSSVYLLLRVGVAFALLYPPFAATLDPVSWTAYFPAFVQGLPLETTMLLNLFGTFEVALALWILSGWRIRIPAAITALLLVAVVVVNLSQFDVLFRGRGARARALASYRIDAATAFTTRGSRRSGMMRSVVGASTRPASADAVASFISSVIFLTPLSRHPRKMPGYASALLT